MIVHVLILMKILFKKFIFLLFSCQGVGTRPVVFLHLPWNSPYHQSKEITQLLPTFSGKLYCEQSCGVLLVLLPI